jgi:hypothetical protein
MLMLYAPSFQRVRAWFTMKTMWDASFDRLRYGHESYVLVHVEPHQFYMSKGVFLTVDQGNLNTISTVVLLQGTLLPHPFRFEYSSSICNHRPSYIPSSLT